MIPKGSKVRQAMPVVEGEVVETRFNEEKQALEYRVDYADADGEPHSRWFAEDQLEQTDSKENT